MSDYKIAVMGGTSKKGSMGLHEGKNFLHIQGRAGENSVTLWDVPMRVDSPQTDMFRSLSSTFAMRADMVCVLVDHANLALREELRERFKAAGYQGKRVVFMDIRNEDDALDVDSIEAWIQLAQSRGAEYLTRKPNEAREALLVQARRAGVESHAAKAIKA